jgi:hypothetical protein
MLKSVNFILDFNLKNDLKSKYISKNYYFYLRCKIYFIIFLGLWKNQFPKNSKNYFKIHNFINLNKVILFLIIFLYKDFRLFEFLEKIILILVKSIED